MSPIYEGIGGGVWESNPTDPKLSPRSNGFEVRASHQTRCASAIGFSADSKGMDSTTGRACCEMISEARISMALQYLSPRRIARALFGAALHKRQHLHATARHGPVFWQQSGEREVACQPGRFDQHWHHLMRRAGPYLFQHRPNLIGADIERNQVMATVAGCDQFF